MDGSIFSTRSKYFIAWVGFAFGEELFADLQQRRGATRGEFRGLLHGFDHAIGFSQTFVGFSEEVVDLGRIFPPREQVGEVVQGVGIHLVVQQGQSQAEFVVLRAAEFFHRTSFRLSGGSVGGVHADDLAEQREGLVVLLECKESLGGFEIGRLGVRMPRQEILCRAAGRLVVAFFDQQFAFGQVSVFVVGFYGQDMIQAGNGVLRTVFACVEQGPVAAGDHVVREILQSGVDRPVGIVVFFQSQQCFEFAFERL